MDVTEIKIKIPQTVRENEDDPMALEKLVQTLGLIGANTETPTPKKKIGKYDRSNSEA